MVLVENCGYIFNSDELLYLLKLMGTNYAVGINMTQSTKTLDEIKSSLLNKGYVFRDFDNEYMLNTDVTELLEPIAFISGFISLRYKNDDIENDLYFYIKNEGFTVSEVVGAVSDRLVLEHYTDKKDVYSLIKDRAEFENISENSTKVSYEFLSWQFAEVMKLLESGEGEKAAEHIDKMKLPQKQAELLKAITEKGVSLLSMVFCEDIKNHPNDMFYLVFYAVNGGIYILEPETEKTIIRSLTSDEMLMKIREKLDEYMGISVGEYEKLIM